MLRPKTEDSLFVRIAKALNVRPHSFAHDLGLSYSEMLAIIRSDHKDLDVDTIDIWVGVKKELMGRIGMLMAANNELDAALQRHRARIAITDPKANNFKRAKEVKETIEWMDT